ncbi:hypothetical protein AB7942_04560 [Neobacillus sp. BF23-41]
MRAVGTDSLGRTFTAQKDELFFVNNSRPKFMYLSQVQTVTELWNTIQQQ